MKKMLNAVRRSLPEVLGVLVVLTLNVVIFGLSGHILFSDTIRVSFSQPLIGNDSSFWFKTRMLMLTFTFRFWWDQIVKALMI